ncbi:MAG TPA: FHA domain-containing protein [Phenylobacterium sp.]
MAVPLTGAVPPPDKAAASATHAAEQNRAHRRGECEQLDAANIPACADRMPPRQTGAPRAAAPTRSPAASSPPAPATMAPTGVAKPATSAQAVAAARPAKPRGAARPAHKIPAAKAGPWQAAIDAVHRQPILAGGAGGALVLLLAGAVWGAAGGFRRRPRAPAVTPPRATPPTAFRRDVVLKDEAGRDWRAAGAALTPGVVAGSGPESQLRLTGDGVASRHLMLWVCDGRLLARPMAEPVFLNDRLLRGAAPEIVSTGDHLRLGRADFTIMID